MYWLVIAFQCSVISSGSRLVHYVMFNSQLASQTVNRLPDWKGGQCSLAMNFASSDISSDTLLLWAKIPRPKKTNKLLSKNNVLKDIWHNLRGSCCFILCTSLTWLFLIYCEYFRMAQWDGHSSTSSAVNIPVKGRRTKQYRYTWLELISEKYPALLVQMLGRHTKNVCL